MDYREGKKSLEITQKRGEAFGLCATMNRKYVCCNVHVLRSVSNCPFDCSYCFLQNYLNDDKMSVVGDTQALIAEVAQKTALEPWRFFRIGTWELGDSLALEGGNIRSACELVEAFADIPNAILELKTKSDQVQPILGLKHNGRTVFACSLNPDSVIRREEHRTASAAARIAALQKAQDDGYLIALHFDPMIWHEGWFKNYSKLVKDVFAVLSPERIAWISLGSLRFNPEMKKRMEHNFPGSRLTAAEMVVGDDQKVRYVKPLRIQMYRHLVSELRAAGAGRSTIYLCMERWDMWKKILGVAPSSPGHFDFLMTESLDRRFPGLVHQRPQRELYDPPTE